MKSTDWHSHRGAFVEQPPAEQLARRQVCEGCVITDFQWLKDLLAEPTILESDRLLAMFEKDEHQLSPGGQFRAWATK